MGRKKATTEYFVERARQVHGDRYDYSLAKYQGRETKLSIICPTHGKFEQMPVNHYQGKGCPACGRYKGGWDTLHWTALQGVHKLYAILCYLDGEWFVKIGKTTKPIVTRFSGSKLPYDYSKLGTVSIKDGYTEQEVSELEISVHNALGDKYSYRPKKRFSGSTECYSVDVLFEKKFQILFGIHNLTDYI